MAFSRTPGVWTRRAACHERETHFLLPHHLGEAGRPVAYIVERGWLEGSSSPFSVASGDVTLELVSSLLFAAIYLTLTFDSTAPARTRGALSSPECLRRYMSR